MKRIILLGLGVALLCAAGCGKREKIIARVGKETITESEFKQAFLERFRGEENARRKPLEDRVKFVRDMAVSKAKYLEARARGLDKKPEVKEEIEQTVRRKALDLLYEEKVINAVVTEEAMRKFYDRSAQEVRARHILLRLPEADSLAADTVRIRARLDSIKRAIDGGLSFQAAAAMFSEDQSTRADSGDIGWFGWGRMVDEFQEAAWAAPVGKVVGPVRTMFGYHLILVEEKRPVQDRRPYEESKALIRNQLREAEGARMTEIAKQYVASLRERNKLKYVESELEAFRARLADPTVSKGQSVAPLFTAEQKEKVVATYKGGKATVNDLIQKLGNNAGRVDWNDPQSVKDLLHAVVDPRFLERAAEAEGLYKKAQSLPEVQQAKRQALIRMLEKEEITDKLQSTPEEERRYYETHLANFIQPEQRTIREIFIKEDSLKAVRVRERALRGEDFKKLALRFNEKESTKYDTGRIGPWEERRFGLIGRTAFTLEKVGDISPVIPVGKNYSVIQLLGIYPSRTKSFEEAEAEVKRQYRQAKTEELQRALEEMVLKKFRYQLDEKALAAALPLPEEEPAEKSGQ